MTFTFTNKARKQFLKLDKPIQDRISKYINEVSALQNPRDREDGLTGNIAGLWRYRVGDYRVICKILDDELVITVVRVGHRHNVYTIHLL